MKLTHCIPLLRLSALLACTSAYATNYDLWQGPSPLVAKGASYATAFDTTLLFTTGSQRIDSARLSLSFSGGQQLVAGEPTSVLTAQSNGYSAYDFFSNYADSPDVALLLLDGTSPGAGAVKASSAHYQTDTVTRQDPVGYWTESCTVIVGCQSFYHQVGINRYVDRVVGYGGTFSYTKTLDASQLAAFGGAGAFRYGFTVADGGLQLLSAELVFTTSPVPETGTPWMMAAGLAALATMRGLQRGGWQRRVFATATAPDRL